MSLYKKFSIKGILAGAAIAAVIGAGAIAFNTVHTNATTVFDCDNNAVIYCGAQSAKGVADVNALVAKYDNSGIPGHQYADTHAIYSAFGISSTGIHSLASHVVMGQVHKDGTVWLNGKQIGANALSAGRVNFPGSTPIPGTHAFMRPPSVSFGSNSLDAYIGYENGVPAWAVLVACGNPIKFNHPKISIMKQVYNPATKKWGEDATFQNGQNIYYALFVTNTGSATATNVKVADALPVGQTYNKGTTKVNSKVFADGIYSMSGINIGSLAPGQRATVTFWAAATLPATKCGNTAMINTGVAGADNVPAVKDTAGSHVNVNCVAVCSNLTAPTYAVEPGQKLTFTATATYKGVTVKNYTFKVDGKVVQVSGSRTYDFVSNQSGNHSVAVVVTFSNGHQSGGSGACLKQVTVKEKAPVIVCKALTASDNVVKPNEEIVFTAHASVEGNAKILSYIFRLDGKEVQNTIDKTYTFVQSKDGTYVVDVTVHTDHGDVTSDRCAKSVRVQKVPKPVLSCDLLTVSPAVINEGQAVTATTTFTAANGATFKQATYTFGDGSQEVVTSQLDSDGNVVANHTYNKAGDYTVNVALDFDVNGKAVNGVTDTEKCVAKVTVGAVKPVETPPVLTNTGPGDVAGIFVGTSMIGAFLHRKWTLRRSR